MAQKYDDKLKELEAATRRSAASVAAASSSSASSTSSGHSRSLPSPDSNPLRVWIAGFPRALLATVLQKHADELLARHAPVTTVAKPKIHNFTTAYSIAFETNEQAEEFVQRVKALGVQWHDPRLTRRWTSRCGWTCPWRFAV
eukprot:4443165-Pyramimonas_sp.AAC.1